MILFKNLLRYLVLALLFITMACSPNKNTSKEKLRHIVLLKFKDSTSNENVALVKNTFAKLPSKIKEIQDFEWGVDNSNEGLDKGFSHAFLVTFASEEDREIYLPHPDHQAFVDVLKPHLDDVLVLDYWAKD